MDIYTNNLDKADFIIVDVTNNLSPEVMNVMHGTVHYTDAIIEFSFLLLEKLCFSYLMK